MYKYMYILLCLEAKHEINTELLITLLLLENRGKAFNPNLR